MGGVSEVVRGELGSRLEGGGGTHELIDQRNEREEVFFDC